MKRLIKKDTPEFLKNFISHSQPKTWEDLSPVRRELREYILREQGNCCAYTELRINEVDNCHIDHYHTRNLFPEKTFDYRNMLVSCNAEKYGAKYKDKQIKTKTDYEYLINPIEELPSEIIQFTLTGEVEPIDNNPKGEKTISFFNLNDKSLVERRKTMVKQLLSMRDDLTEEEIVDSMGEFETMIRQLYNASR